MTGKTRLHNVLVVEDNPAMRAFISQLVSETGAVVHECDDGDQAFELYQRIRPDLVVMDVKMPRMDGLTATRAIRSLDPNAKVVIVTECADPRYRVAARKAGARAFLMKTQLCDLSDLLMQWNGVERPGEAG